MYMIFLAFIISTSINLLGYSSLDYYVQLILTNLLAKEALI